jgi:hypothetical protein
MAVTLFFSLNLIYNLDFGAKTKNKPFLIEDVPKCLTVLQPAKKKITTLCHFAN